MDTFISFFTAILGGGLALIAIAVIALLVLCLIVWLWLRSALK